jgi:hypothetical protein
MWKSPLFLFEIVTKITRICSALPRLLCRQAHCLLGRCRRLSSTWHSHLHLNTSWYIGDDEEVADFKWITPDSTYYLGSALGSMLLWQLRFYRQHRRSQQPRAGSTACAERRAARERLCEVPRVKPAAA